MIYKGLKWKILAVFFDDILIFSQTAEQHIKDVETTLDRLIDAGLTVFPSEYWPNSHTKAVFSTESVSTSTW
ncbi:hypothetical protein Naga_100016g62 [Nannochloropsis gaditana]|uniref:Reverse transcriptase domain-containing protein n=1 Tax=Nannochloropsis gaditana TaxID=72520 RepID=W7TXQ9_9STRA|nr:hypothetical protein Naga_100016g62 [Nannochloropsis gaditana]